MTRLAKWMCSALLALGVSSPAFGYYHFVRFPSRSGPFTPVYEKFDINALPGRTLRYYIAETGPDKISATDSFTSVVSQIKLAAKAWNDVESSELRLVFGGLINPATPQTSPGIDIVFDDEIPPGVIAQAGPITYDYSSLPSGATFVPVVRSKLQLRKDLTRYPLQGGSYEVFETFDEMFFGTLVHEFGHTLGLQHSFTSGAMATRATRATSKARPLTGDDIAGLSVLYPTEAFSRTTGSIRGRVVIGSTGVNMASVVAISPNGPAISALTNPDGTYRIDGIPAGVTYYVYAHPLPTPDSLDPLPGGIYQPWDSLNARGSRITNRELFSTQFHSLTFVVRAGTTVENVDFNVQRRSSLPINVVQTYGFVGQVTVKPAPINGQSASGTVVAWGLAGADGNPVQGLSVRVLGGSDAIPGSIKKYPYAPSYVQFDVMPPYGDGPRHIIFSAGGDQYVLPAAFNLIQRPAPTVDTVTASTDSQGRAAAIVTGKNLASDSRILFDGIQSSVIRTNADGSMLVSLPPAPGGHRARVVALNSDGQSSLFTQGTRATQFTYDPADTGVFALSVNAVPAGSDLLVEVNGTGTNFVEGQTTIGFGSSDIAVRRIWVVSPTKLFANISVVPHSPIASTTVTVNSGLQLFSAPLAFEIQPLNPRQLSINYSSLRNLASGGAGITAGSRASVSVNNLQGQSGVTATLNGNTIRVVGVSGNVVTFEIPADAPNGPAILRIFAADGTGSYPAAINIDAPPPVIQSALAGVSGTLDSSRYVSPHDLMTLVVDNLFEPQSGGDVKVVVGGIEHSPIAVLKNTNGSAQVQIILSSTVPQGDEVPVRVAVETRVSDAFPINIKTN
ncbi:hypothetical protein F183_A38170 [Bryobacterales bacterium F-183]|nr:hypothetical protein F183_A38170 [Bryobacterales bacterium F-183]